MSFKSPEAVLRAAMIADAGVNVLVGSRIYPHQAPASTPMPFVLWRRSGINREQTLGPPMGVPRVSVEYTIFATTYYSARNVADAMRKALDGYGGTLDNVEVKQASLTNESDDLATLEGSETPNAYSVTQTYDVMWQET
jgi:hypothetical protein